MKRILVTGGAGFIGSYLVARLLARGDSVLVIDNYATGRRENLAAHPLLEVVEGTIADSALVDSLFERSRSGVIVDGAASLPGSAKLGRGRMRASGSQVGC